MHHNSLQVMKTMSKNITSINYLVRWHEEESQKGANGRKVISFLFATLKRSSMHNLEVMHVEKKACDDLVGTLLYIERKTQNTLNAHKGSRKCTFGTTTTNNNIGRKDPYICCILYQV